MSASEAIQVGEGWISEHYFTTTTGQSFQARVLARRTEWNSADAPTPRSRFTSTRTTLLSHLTELGEQLAADAGVGLAARLADDGVQQTAHTSATEWQSALGYLDTAYTRRTEGLITYIGTPGVADSAPLAIIEARPVDAVEDLLGKDNPTLFAPVELDGHECGSVARLLTKLFTLADAPAFALVFAGRWALVAEQRRWAEGRYLAVDLLLVCERGDTKRGGEIDRALTCLCAESLAPDADGDIWWSAVLEESVRHTTGVSSELREGVRESIEIIANDVVNIRRARGLDPLPADQANELAHQALRFLYRILFLLYAEASPELSVLPVGTPEYDAGYSLDRLRELALVELTDPAAMSGSHLYESLAVLFRLVDEGHTPADDDGEGLHFQALRADLFAPAAIALISETGLTNAAMQQVLQRLMLSKESRGSDRGFISYAELGINQLGAVYEGLMSYTGFFAEQDLVEVARGGDPSKGSWVVPVDRSHTIDSGDIVRSVDPVTGESRPLVHSRGSFVFRLAGRERQQSASYYTPEVLTRFTVSQALAELLDQDGHITTAEEILHLTVCEPALGSGAFAIEAVRQLAEEYLTRRAKELGQEIDPEDRPRQLRRVKTYIALHQVYGVDLNATAVELAEISLWLDTMAPGLRAPWFGLHLRRGNSLIGARHAVYSAQTVRSKAWLSATPTSLPLGDGSGAEGDADDGDGLAKGSIFHFLLPAKGWGSTVDSKEGKTLAPDVVAQLKTWRSGVRAKPDAKQMKRLAGVSRQVERLWYLARRRLELAEQGVHRNIDLWGRDVVEPSGGVSREEIEASLADPNGAYRRLRRVMDAWCALWFWPLTDTTVQTPRGTVFAQPPTLDQWVDACAQLLGMNVDGPQAESFETVQDWSGLEMAEEMALSFGSVRSVEAVVSDHPWLAMCERIADRQGFFHWELDFATVFARGGFDLQVGNPPWVRPRSDVDALLAEGDPWWQLALKPTEQERKEKRKLALSEPRVRDLVLDGTAEIAATAAYLGEPVNYPYLDGLQPDMYRCFMEQTWSHESAHGIVGLIHPETHFTDEKAGLLRAATYPRLRRHWQFVNELILFEIDHHVSFGVHVYGTESQRVDFLTAASLYHPDTVERSLRFTGEGPEPGIKDDEGNWDQRPHSGRIIRVTDDVLATWREVLGSGDVPAAQARMLYTVSRSVSEVLGILARSRRIGELGLEFSPGWHEKNDRTKGRFEQKWGAPKSWSDAIIQGPHLYVAGPFYKEPNETMRNNLDWSPVNLETLAPDALPITAFKPAGDRATYDAAYTRWGPPEARTSARDYYRLAWRAMAANRNERTLFSAVIPPGSAHPNGVFSVGKAGFPLDTLVDLSGWSSSLLLDLLVRVAPKSGIYQAVFERLAYTPNTPLRPHLILRTLRLNCLTNAYADLYQSCWDDQFLSDTWTGGIDYPNRPPLSAITPTWTPDTPLRRASDRRQALVEIDALVALALGVTADQLCTVYRTQFAVLRGYDRNTYVYDANGRLLPPPVLKAYKAHGDDIPLPDRTYTHPSADPTAPRATYTYSPPFRTLDREADLRAAYTHFEGLLTEER